MTRKTYLPIVSSANYFAEIARSSYEGYEASNVIAYAPDVKQSEGRTGLWEEPYRVTFPSSAGPVYISSSSVADVGGIFVGVALDANYNEHTVSATLNGQNSVQLLAATETNFLWVNSLANFTPTKTQGTLYVATSNTTTAGKPDDTTSIIGIVRYDSALLCSDEMMRNGAYIVPANKDFYAITDRAEVGKNKDVIIYLQVEFYNEALGTHNAPWLVGGPFHLYQTSRGNEFRIPSPVPPKTRFEYSVATESPNSAATIDLSFYTITRK